MSSGVCLKPVFVQTSTYIAYSIVSVKNTAVLTTLLLTLKATVFRMIYGDLKWYNGINGIKLFLEMRKI